MRPARSFPGAGWRAYCEGKGGPLWPVGEAVMTITQGDLALLQDPVAQQLLGSRKPAQLAYVWTDGTPRTVPIWFTWTGEEIVFGTPPKAPKLKALAQNDNVSVSIDESS